MSMKDLYLACTHHQRRSTFYFSFSVENKFVTLYQRSKNFNQPNRHHIVEGAGANACPGKDSLSKINCCFLAPKKLPSYCKVLQQPCSHSLDTSIFLFELEEKPIHRS